MATDDKTGPSGPSGDSPERELAKVNELGTQLGRELEGARAQSSGSRTPLLTTEADRAADDRAHAERELARIDAAMANREVPAGVAPGITFDPMAALVDILHGLNEIGTGFASSQQGSPAAKAFAKLAATARAHLALAGEVVPVIATGAPKPSPYAKPAARVLGARGPAAIKRTGPVLPIGGVQRVPSRVTPLRLPPRPAAPPTPIVRQSAVQRSRRDLQRAAANPGQRGFVRTGPVAPKAPAK